MSVPTTTVPTSTSKCGHAQVTGIITVSCEVVSVWTKCGRGVSTLIPEGFRGLEKSVDGVDGVERLYKEQILIGVHVHTVHTTAKYLENTRE